MDTLFLLGVFFISAWLGYKVISEVPPLLHTPLMSGTNAISGVTIIGSLLTTAFAVGMHNKALGFVAIVFAMVNLVGGFVVTDRMFRMFKT